MVLVAKGSWLTGPSPETVPCSVATRTVVNTWIQIPIRATTIAEVVSAVATPKIKRGWLACAYLADTGAMKLLLVLLHMVAAITTLHHIVTLTALLEVFGSS